MPLNIPGLLVPFHLIINPRLVLPSIIVKDIRQLDFKELRKAGYRGAVFDKDNCLTLPHEDALVPELKDAWRECREAFGTGNVLVVSNSAGTRLDPGEIQAESVTYQLSVPVLRHKSFKPSYSCISAIRKYFRSLPKPLEEHELIIVGDRIFTDIALANRMTRSTKHSAAISVSEKEKHDVQLHEYSREVNTRTGPLAIWTDGVWKKENMALRWMESSLMHGLLRLLDGKTKFELSEGLSRFVKPIPPPHIVEKTSLLSRLLGRLRGAS
ncbi:hypothetical protein ABKN59_007290 [Abortiporus biennis]